MTTKHANEPECILVTGAAGFIGRHVVTTLLNRGYRIVAHQYRKELPTKLINRCERILTGDICDSNLQKEALRGVQVVCHLAAYVPTQYVGLQEAVRCYTINAEATLALATHASENGISRFIHFSTGNMYADSVIPCKETDRIFPSRYGTAYMVSKLAAEIYLENISKHLPLEIVILRIGTPYGPGEPSNKVIPTFLRLAGQGCPLKLANSGVAKFNFIFVSDIADLVSKVIKGNNLGIYNVASGEHTTLLELANTVITLYGEHVVQLNIEPKVRNAFLGFPAISIVKAQKAFNFSPRSLKLGLKEYKANFMNDDIRP